MSWQRQKANNHNFGQGKRENNINNDVVLGKKKDRKIELNSMLFKAKEKRKKKLLVKKEKYWQKYSSVSQKQWNVNTLRINTKRVGTIKSS